MSNKKEVTMLKLCPTQTMPIYGHVCIWDTTNEKPTMAYYTTIKAKQYTQRICAIREKLEKAGYEVKSIIADPTKVNYKKKVDNFKRWCHENRVTTTK